MEINDGALLIFLKGLAEKSFIFVSRVLRPAGYLRFIAFNFCAPRRRFFHECILCISLNSIQFDCFGSRITVKSNAAERVDFEQEIVSLYILNL